MINRIDLSDWWRIKFDEKDKGAEMGWMAKQPCSGWIARSSRRATDLAIRHERDRHKVLLAPRY